ELQLRRDPVQARAGAAGWHVWHTASSGLIRAQGHHTPTWAQRLRPARRVDVGYPRLLRRPREYRCTHTSCHSPKTVLGHFLVIVLGLFLITGPWHRRLEPPSPRAYQPSGYPW